MLQYIHPSNQKQNDRILQQPLPLAIQDLFKEKTHPAFLPGEYFCYVYIQSMSGVIGGYRSSVPAVWYQ